MPRIRFVLRNGTQWTLITPRRAPDDLLIRTVQTMLPHLTATAKPGHQQLAVEWLSLKVRHALALAELAKEGISQEEADKALEGDSAFAAYRELSKTYSLAQSPA